MPEKKCKLYLHPLRYGLLVYQRTLILIKLCNFIKKIISAPKNCKKHSDSKHGFSRHIPLFVHDAPYLAGPPLYILAFWIRTSKKMISK